MYPHPPITSSGRMSAARRRVSPPSSGCCKQCVPASYRGPPPIRLLLTATPLRCPDMLRHQPSQARPRELHLLGLHGPAALLEVWHSRLSSSSNQMLCPSSFGSPLGSCWRWLGRWRGPCITPARGASISRSSRGGCLPFSQPTGEILSVLVAKNDHPPTPRGSSF